MNGLAADANLDGLRDASLIQIAVGQNEVILHFHPAASVMITSDVIVSQGTGGSTRYGESSTELARALFPLLGKPVTEAKALPPGTLHLEFGVAGYVEVLDSWASYESYTIVVGDVLIVV